MANLKITELKAYLNNKSQKELIEEIVELTKQYPDVKEYYSLKIKPESEDEVFEKYMKIINNEFFPDRGYGKMRYSVVNKAIRDFKKISGDKKKIAELMLYYAQIGVEFTNTYGDIDERFYYAIEKAFINALEYIFKNDLEGEFSKKAEKIRAGSDDIGWGFSDNMNQIYFEYYSDSDED